MRRLKSHAPPLLCTQPCSLLPRSGVTPPPPPPHSRGKVGKLAWPHIPVSPGLQGSLCHTSAAEVKQGLHVLLLSPRGTCTGRLGGQLVTALEPRPSPGCEGSKAPVLQPVPDLYNTWSSPLHFLILNSIHYRSARGAMRRGAVGQVPVCARARSTKIPSRSNDNRSSDSTESTRSRGPTHKQSAKGSAARIPSPSRKG